MGWKKRWLLPTAAFLVIIVCIALFRYSYHHDFPPNHHFHPGAPALIATNRLGSPGNDDIVPPTNLSHIFFAVAGSTKTWRNRSGYSALWYRPGVTRATVWLDQAPSPPSSWPTFSPPYRVSDNVSLKYGDKAIASRIARIVKEAYEFVTANTTTATANPPIRWFVMGDDDTLFFPENVAAILAKYDHRKMYYVGSPSESVEQNLLHSYGTAFGGGGIALSFPAAAAVARIMDGCLERYVDYYGGDERVHLCVAELGVSLTREPGFHQLDIRGDAYGLLAAHPVAALATLHHLDSIAPVFPFEDNGNGSTTQAEVLRRFMQPYSVDPARMLQQTVCYVPQLNWSVSVSWGYTVQLYPWIVSSSELATAFRTFQTWGSYSEGPFTFDTKPWGQEPCNRPLVFFLDQVRKNVTAHPGIGGRGSRSEFYSTVTEYKKQQFLPQEGTPAANQKKKWGWIDLHPASKIGVVRVTAPRLDPSYWKELAPRRQCCDVEKAPEMDLIDVRVRKCRSNEALTPA